MPFVRSYASGGGSSGGTLTPGSGSGSWTTGYIPFGKSDGTLDENQIFQFDDTGVSNSILKLSPTSNGNSAIIDNGAVFATEIMLLRGDALLRLGSGSGNFGHWQIDASGHFKPSVSDDTLDLGDGTTDPRRLFLTQYASFEEMTAPTGVANKALLYAEDNGSGKTRLVVIFGTGAAQVLATEP